MLKNVENKKILILAPHTDDGELGCGGTISKLTSENADVYYMVFSVCTRSLPRGLNPNTLTEEVTKATQKLGIPKQNLIIHDYDVRVFNECRQSILDDMIKFRNEHNPSLIFLPARSDIHQDHEVVTNEGIRAFKKSNILGYEMPWNNLTFDTSCFSILNKQNLDCKMDALNEYNSQKNRPYFNEDFIRSLAITRGTQIGSSYAEAFEVIRMIWD
jgi:LmbE family N-acetylglucosaminyl deacetylase